MEFAFVLPILTLFLFGIVQFGIAYDKQQSINAAGREGARLAALPVSDLQQIAERAVAASAMSAVGNDPKVVVSDSAGVVAGVRCPGGTYSRTDNCASPTTIDQTNESLMPCGRTTPSNYARVRVSTPFDLTFPLFDFGIVTIDAEAEFRCE